MTSPVPRPPLDPPATTPPRRPRRPPVRGDARGVRPARDPARHGAGPVRRAARARPRDGAPSSRPGPDRRALRPRVARAPGGHRHPRRRRRRRRPRRRRYSAAAGYAEVLLDPDSLSTMAPMPPSSSQRVGTFPALVDAFRSGGGVDWNDVRRASPRPRRGPTARVPAPAHAGVAPRGSRTSTRGSGRVAPGSRTWPAAAAGRRSRWGGPTRIRGRRARPRRGGDRRARGSRRAGGGRGPGPVPRRRRRRPALEGRYDLVTSSRRSTTCRGRSRSCAPSAAARARRHGDRHGRERRRVVRGAPGDDFDRLMYGYSVLVCLPNGLAEQPSAGPAP